MKTKFAVGLMMGLMGASFAVPASATSIVFTDFSNLSGLQLNGSTRSIHNPNCTANGGNGSFCSAVTDGSGNEVRA